MKRSILVLFFSFFLLQLIAQKQFEKLSTSDTAKVIRTVETACGQCKFGLPGKNCDLAVRVDGRAYFVDGTDIDAHGDAHAKDGFCLAIRKAEVQGEIVKDRFKVSYFKLLTEKKIKQTKTNRQ